MNAPLLPPLLRRGDAMVVVSPSWGGAGILRARTERAVAALRAAGYSVRVAAHALGTSDGERDWLSGGRAERLADLHAAFADPTVRAVVAAIGGDHSAQLLEELDIDLIGRNPKVLCGYSDTTCILHAVHAATGMVTFYGPAALPGLEVFGILWMTALQRDVPDHLLARVTALDTVGSQALLPMAYAGVGVAARVGGGEVLLVLGAIACLVTTLPMLLLPGMRTLSSCVTPGAAA